MATRFMYKALVTAALGIALSLLLAETTTASAASSNTAGALQLDPPAAPSNCRSRHIPAGGEIFFDYTIVSWRDNSTNEDGFTFEHWRKQSGVWVLVSSFDTTSTQVWVTNGRLPPGHKFRVKAFNAAGDSSWSNWGH